MKKRQICKRLAAWILTFAMVFGNSSFAALAEEVSQETPAAKEQETALPASELAADTSAEDVQPASDQAEEAADESVAGGNTSLEAAESSDDGLADAVLAEEATAEAPAGADSELPADETGESSTGAEQDEIIEELADVQNLNLTDELTVDAVVELAEEGDEAGGADDTEDGAEAEGRWFDGATLEFDCWWDGTNTWVYENQQQGISVKEPNSEHRYEWKAVGDNDFGEAGSIEAVAELPDSDTVSVEPDGDIPHLAQVTGNEERTEDAAILVVIAYDKTTNEIAGYGAVPVVVRPEVYEPDYPFEGSGKGQVYIGDSLHIAPEMISYVEDWANPYGTEMTLYVTNIEILGNYTWDGNYADTAILEVGATEEGWDLTGLEYGYARVRVTYGPGSDGSGRYDWYDMDVWVNGDAYNLNWEYPERIDQMLVGDEMTIDVGMSRGWLDEDCNQQWEDLDDFTLSVVDENGELTYDTDVIDVQVEGQTLTITGADTGETNICLRGLLAGDEGSYEVCSADIHITVTESYWYLEPLFLENVPLGESLDLSSVEWTLTRRYTGENGWASETVDIDDVNYRLRIGHYNTDAWEFQAGENFLPTLTRAGDWGTSVMILAEELQKDENGEIIYEEENVEESYPLWQEIATQEYWFDGLDYSVWFEDGVHEPENNHSYVFTNDELTLTLNEDNLADKGEKVSVDWAVYRGWDEAADDYADEIVNDTESGNTYYTISQDTITLDGGALAEAAWKDGNDTPQDIVVVARVTLGDAELFCIDVWVGLYEPEQSLNWNKPGNILQGDDFWIWACDMDCYVRSPEYPYGENIGVEITGIEVTRSWAWDKEAQENVETDDTIVSVAYNEEPDNPGWNLYGENCGYVDLDITYVMDGVDEPCTETGIRLNVSGDNWYLEWSDPTGTDDMLPGSTKTIENVVLKHDYINWEEDGRHIYGEETDYYGLSLEWDPVNGDGTPNVDEDGNPYLTYDPNKVGVEVGKDGKSLIITANEEENYGDTYICIRAMRQETDEDGAPVYDGNGEPVLYEQGQESIRVNITNGYWNLTPVSLGNVPLGDTLVLAEVDWQSMLYYMDEDGVSQQQDIASAMEGLDVTYRTRLESYDPDAWSCVEGSDEALPSLTRTGDGGTSVKVVTECADLNEEGEVVTDDEGNEIWYSLCEREYWFDGLDYSVWFEGGVYEPKDNHTYVFTDDELTLTLNEDNLADKGENVSVDWAVYCGRDEAEDDYADKVNDADSDDVYYETLQNTITLHGGALAEAAWKDGNDTPQDIVVVARVMLGDAELFCTDVWVGLYEPEQSLNWNKPGNILQGDDIWVGIYDTDCYVRSPEYPYGENIGVEIIDIEVTGSWAWDEEAQENVQTDDAIVSVAFNGEPDNPGWNLRGEDFGYVDLKVTYQMEGASETSTETGIRLNVSGDNWYLEWSDPTGTDDMLPGSTKTIENVVLKHDYINWDEDGRHIYGEETEYYALSVEQDTINEDGTPNVDEDGNPYLTYDPNMVDVKVGDGRKRLIITANGEEYYGGTDIYIRAMCQETDEEGAPVYDDSGEPVLYEQCGENLHVNITNGYWNLTPAVLENVLLGDTLELGDVEWSLAFNYMNANGKNDLYDPFADENNTDESKDKDNYRIRLCEGGYDTNAWVITEGTEEALLPTLKRIGNWDTNISLVAEERELDEDGNPVMDEENNENWHEVARRDLHFGEIDYSVWFEDIGRFDENRNTWVFTDEELELLLNTENLDGKNATVEIQAGYWQRIEDTEEHEFISQDVWSAGYEFDPETGVITVDGAVLKELREENRNFFILRAVVLVNGSEEADDHIGSNIWDPEYDLELPGNEARLPNWNFDLDGFFEGRVRNSAYPHGLDVNGTITGVEVTNHGEEGSDRAVEYEAWEEGYGWNFRMNEFGHATVTLTYDLAYHDDVTDSDETYSQGDTYTFEIYVNDNVSGINIESSTGTDQLLPGNSLDLTANVWWQQWDEENGEDSVNTDNLTVKWNVESGNEAVTVRQDSEEPSVLHVTANDEMEGRDVHIEARAYQAVEADDTEVSGEPELNEVANGDCWIHVTDSYYQLMVSAQTQGETPEPVDITEMEPGDTAVLDTELLWYDADHKGGAAEDAVFFLDEWDEDVIKITDADGNVMNSERNSGSLPFTVEKLVNEEVRTTMRAASWNQEMGEYEERAEYGLDFNAVNYDIWFEEGRFDEHGDTWVFTDEEALPLTLNTGNLEGRNVSLEVQAGMWKESVEKPGQYDFVPYENDDSDTTEWYESNDWYTLDQETGTVVLKGSVLAAVGDERARDFALGVKVMSENIEGMELSDSYISVQVVEPEESLEDCDGDGPVDIVAGSGLAYDGGQMRYYVRNAAYPHGEEFSVNIDSIVSAYADSTEEDAEAGSDDASGAMHCYRDENGTWRVDVLAAGIGRQVTLTYTVSNSELWGEDTKTFSNTWNVVGEIYYLDAYLDANTDRMLPGQSRGLQVAMSKGVYDPENQETVYTPLDPADYTLKFDYDENLITLQDGIVTAGDALGDTGIRVSGDIPLETAEGSYSVEDWVDVHVVEEYLEVIAGPVYTEPGDVVFIEDTAPELRHFRLDVPDGEPVNPVSFCFEEKDNGLIATSGDRSQFMVTAENVIWRNGFVTTGITVYGYTEDDNEIYGWCQVRICRGHQWDDGKVTREATCASTGETTYTCTVCKATKTEEIARLTEHSWDDGKVTREATCASAGVKTYTCTVCSETKTEEIAKLTEHSWNGGEVTTPATCKAAGVRTYTCKVCGETKTEEIARTTEHVWNGGVVTKAATCTAAGVRTYTCTVCGTTKTEPIAATGHKWGAWQAATAATVFAPATQKRTCTVCGTAQTQNVGSKLAATMTLTAGSLKMKKKQSTTKFKVTGMANGDYLASVTSSNTKVLKVSSINKTGTFKLTAQKKTGKATLTIKLASGLTKTLKVTVQSGTVKTTKISGLTKKLTILKKQKVTLAPIITPVTSQQKVTYKTSNKKVATVNSKGVITAKKAGKAKITVKSGSKKYVITVTVK